jgi:HEAT repeat protein
MGKRQKASQSGMSFSITNYKLRITNLQRLTSAVAFLCLFFVFANTSFAQNLSDDEIRQQAERLRSGESETRRDALHKLRASESENASRIATAGLTDKSEIVRATAPFSILALPNDEAAENLVPQLKDKSEYVRRETAYALGKTHSARATRPLVEILQKDKQYSVKCSAAVALGEIADVSAVEALTAVLRRNSKDEEEFLRRSAARSIGQIAEITLQKEFLSQTEIKDYSVFVQENRKSLSAKFLAIQSAVVVMIQILQNPKEADDVKREAAFALGAIGDSRAIPILETKIAAEDYYLAEISRQAVKKILNLK